MCPMGLLRIDNGSRDLLKPLLPGVRWRLVNGADDEACAARFADADELLSSGLARSHAIGFAQGTDDATGGHRVIVLDCGLVGGLLLQQLVQRDEQCHHHPPSPARTDSRVADQAHRADPTRQRSGSRAVSDPFVIVELHGRHVRPQRRWELPGAPASLLLTGDDHGLIPEHCTNSAPCSPTSSL
jgi:hypothetical protein